MPLPQWKPTLTALHLASQVISTARLADISRLPNHLHHSLTPTVNGSSTGPLPHLGTFEVNYRTGKLVHTQNSVEISSHEINGATQRGLFEAMSEEIHDMDYDVALQAPSELSDDMLSYDSAHGSAYADLDWQMFRGIADARAHLNGYQTPLVLWSHGFDLSTIWFFDGDNEEHDPHLNMGFSPGTSSHPEPYIYAYAWPVLPSIRDGLANGWTWHTEWSTHGGLLPYSAFGDTNDPAATVYARLSEFAARAQIAYAADD